MPMRAEFEALIDELHRRRAAGEDTVFVADATLARLRARQRSVADPTARIPPATMARPACVPPPPVIDLPPGDKPARLQWLRQRVLGDPYCLAQVKPGKQVVFGVGNADADIFFCGEAPGAEEEIQGEPFVGPAGQLLTRMLAGMGLARADVYIGNIMNFRPPLPEPIGNRPPTPAEIAYCLPFLRAQLAIVRPQVIVALGKTAVDGLLGPDPKRRMGAIRGTWSSFADIPLMITFHPSYLLRNQSKQTKRMVWEDLLQVMERVGLPVSDKQRGYFL
jgi:DNA polymerase